MRKQPNSRMCFICGMKNVAGVKVFFYEQDDGSVLARFSGQEIHQGYPGRMHGGCHAAGVALVGRGQVRVVPAETVGCREQFQRAIQTDAVPLFVELTAVGRVVKDRGSYFEGAGEMLLPDGTVAVEAKGKFWKLPLGEIADFDTDREQWRVVPDA